MKIIANHYPFSLTGKINNHFFFQEKMKKCEFVTTSIYQKIYHTPIYRYKYIDISNTKYIDISDILVPSLHLNTVSTLPQSECNFPYARPLAIAESNMHPRGINQEFLSIDDECGLPQFIGCLLILLMSFVRRLA